MYKNAAIMFFLKDSNNFQYVLITLIDDNKPNEFDSDTNSFFNLLENLNKYPPIYSFKLYSPKKEIVYQIGRNINFNRLKSIDELKFKNIIYNRNIIKVSDREIYQILFTISKNNKILGYVDICYDLTYVENNFFVDRKIIFLLTAFLTFFMMFFLIVMVMNMQKRISLLESEVKDVSVIDQLTELYDKDYFIELMKKEFDRVDRKGGISTLLTLDIDNFLEVNDKFGFEFGDLILKTISKILKDIFRNFDIIGRFGGDEIMILMVDSSEEDGFIAAERCRVAIQENKFYYETQEIAITVSVGVASSIKDKDKYNNLSSNNILRNITFDSLNALARAKRTGRNKVIKYSDLYKEE